MTASPPFRPQDLFAHLDQLGIAHRTVEHPAFHTVGDGRDLKAGLPGGHTKNLFMTDKEGQVVLISALADSPLKLNQLHKQIGTRRLSFGAPELMFDLLGVVPGSVTALALINDTQGRVRFLVEAALMEHDPLNFHPLVNTATTAIGRADFIRFVESTGRTLETVDFSQL